MFLRRVKWDPDGVALKVFRVIVDTLPGKTEFELILDDTLNYRVGKEIFGAGTQDDGDAPKTGKPSGVGRPPMGS
jgi:hypothetical protein